MPTKPNMRMGGVDTQGDRGVMSAAMGAADIKARAAKDSGLSAVAGQLSDWADDSMQEDRRIALEKRAETRGIAKEGRVAEREAGLMEQAQTREDKLTKEKRAYEAPLQEAKIGKLKAEERKADRWTASADAVKKKFLSEDDAISYKMEAKEAYEGKREDLRKKRGVIWDSDTNVYAKDEAGEEKELSVQEALNKLDREEAEFLQMIDSKTQLGASSSPAPSIGKINFRKKAK